MTDKSIRVLLVEDSEDDAALVLRELYRADYEPIWIRVQTREAMLLALEQTWDIVLSDYSLPDFDAPSALSVVKECGLDVPFLIVSGTIGEEVAVQAMKLGAHDYILKDRLTRLAPAIERELREARVRAERKRMRHELLVAERMAAIGTLAAGVAHEINNPLAALCANLDVMAQDLADLRSQVEERTRTISEPDAAWQTRLLKRSQLLDEGLHGAREAADRVRQIVSDLRAFSRPSDERRDPVDLHACVETALRLAQPALRHRAKIVRQYGEVPFALGNEGRLTQVFLNLIVNAAQSPSSARASERTIRITTSKGDRGRVRVSVEDNGDGIPPEVLPRIFDPFFTTKPAGEGTGLGLSICQRIVGESKGEMFVESVMGKGTTFSILLPGLVAEEEEPYSSGILPIVRGGMRILVIDEDPLLADAIRNLLALEHKVTVLTHARTALMKIAEGERFDLVLCDAIISELSALQFRDQVAQLAPEQAESVVFMVESSLGLERHSNAVRGVLHIEKPLDEENLRTLIRRFGERARRSLSRRTG
jgi:signal transduction histidine kinase